MNKKMIFNTLGKIFIVEGLLLFFPLIISLVYKEDLYYAYMLPIGILLIIGSLLVLLIKPDRKSIGSKDGLIIVGLSWILMSAFGTLPYLISGSIESFVDAFFETVSGFTTTGASILYKDDFKHISKSIMFYRAFTHFIGGMGVLVFVLAILPQSDGKSIYILKAESSGPQVGKLVSKVKITARILYIMYVAFTILEIILLSISPNMNLYEATVYSFSTAGTGGFAPYFESCANLSSYLQIVIAIFMALFGVNFNLFYMIIIGKFNKAIKSEELITYISIIIISAVTISLNIFYNTMNIYNSFSETLKHSFFNTISFMTSTGFSSTDFSIWPELSKTILLVLMYVGACAGSTGGGLKVSRIIILFKSSYNSLKKLCHPKSVKPVMLEGETLDEDTEKGVLGYFSLIVLFVFISVILLSIDGYSFETNFSAVSSCINNVGLAFGKIGTDGTFGFFSIRSKIIMIVLMLIGRLEIYPIITLLMPKTWTNK